MPDLIEKATGQTRFVPPERMADAVASGLFEAPAGDQAVSVTLPGALHLAGQVPVSELARTEQQAGAHVEAEGDRRSRERDTRIERQHGGTLGKVATVAENAVDTATLGAGGIILDKLGGEEYREGRLERTEANPISAGVGTALGVVASLPAGGEGLAGELAASTPLGKLTELGAQVARGSEEGASIYARAGRTLAGGAIEGTGQGFGQAVQELNNSDDPLTVERIGSALSSNVLFGAGIGAGAAGAGKLFERGLRKGSELLGDYAAGAGKVVTGEIPEDLAQLDTKGLRLADQTERESLVASQVTERASTVDGLTAYRDAVKQANPWTVITEGEPSAMLSQSSKSLRGAMNDPVGLAKNPGTVLKALRVQEQALTRAMENTEEITAKLAARSEKFTKQLTIAIEDAEVGELGEVALSGPLGKRYGAFADVKVPRTGEIALSPKKAAEFLEALKSGAVKSSEQEAFARIPQLVEANRSLQQKIETAMLPESKLTSPRLAQIADARDALAGAGKSKAKTLLDRVMEGGAYSAVAGAVGALPIPGAAAVAPFLGAQAADFITGKLAGKVGQVAEASAKRMSKAVDMFADVTSKVTPGAPVLATQVLSRVAFAPKTKAAEESPKPARAKKGEKAEAAKPDTLATLYKKRSEEIRSQTAYGIDGKAKLKPEARQRMAKTFDAIRATNPTMADKLETAAAVRIAYYANALPRRPDFGVIQTGPDTWQPSDMEMRAWARTVAAGEDPDGVAERLVTGAITPEDAQVMRDLHPEQLAELTQSVLMKLPQLQRALPYKRRLALSILTGIPVDPSMHPTVLTALQSAFVEEPGSAGGMQAPMPSPQFGSVKAEDPTPSQKRSEG